MTLKKQRRVLIANRGEIAIRVARTAKMLGFSTVAVYSEVDAFSEHVQHCDYAVALGGVTPRESYLDVDKIISAAKKTGAQFIHPGYGFLSERPHFVEACEKAGLVFVGPSAESMRLMGDKITARETVDKLEVPRVPGSKGAVKDAAEALTFAKKVGFPILLKAAAGGGGKGMRRVDSDAEISSAFEGATREALGAFGDGSMYVEKLILEPHHVEIQVFGDGKGGAIHLGDRECSIQRRHQKVWEEAPAPILDVHPATRQKMFDSAIKIAKHVKYASAGTFEFIVDGQGNYYFLEMNTRLQVEHPVTEWITGVDLVSWQLRLAAGEFELPAIPERRGSAIEVRIYAEDPASFLPAPGALGDIRLPSGPFVRSDSAFHTAGEVSVHYDPMIAKVSTWGSDRPTAVARLKVALSETSVQPPKSQGGKVRGSLRTNLSFLRRLCNHPDAVRGTTTTDLIGKSPELIADQTVDQTAVLEASKSAAFAAAVGVFQMLGSQEGSSSQSAKLEQSADTAGWKNAALNEGVRSR